MLCAVGGVQAQSLTVDRQMKRYHVPRLAFINKMDRTGADPFKVGEQMRDKLGGDVHPDADPDRCGEKFEGVIDLIKMKALYYDGKKAKKSGRRAIPADLRGRS